MQEQVFGERRIFQHGDLIVQEGSQVRDLYILARGVLEMSTIVDGARMIAGEIQAPEILGEDSFLDGSPRVAMITAKTEVELYIIRYDKLYDIGVGSVPKWFNCLIQIMRNRLTPENHDIRLLVEMIQEFKVKPRKNPNSVSINDMGNLSVLVAEDDQFNADLAKKILEKHGHNVKVASNGLEALEMLVVDHFDLLLMDLQMPVMGGVEAAGLIRLCEAAKSEGVVEHRNILFRLQKKIAGGHVPIIAMTANNREGEEENCLEAGMDYFITKPFRLQKALSALQLVLAANP